MELRAFLNSDGSAAFSAGEPGNMVSAEIEWHAAEMTFTAADGAVVRRVAVTIGGRPEVTGPEPAPVQHEAETAEHVVGAEAGVAAAAGEVKP